MYGRSTAAPQIRKIDPITVLATFNCLGNLPAHVYFPLHVR